MTDTPSETKQQASFTPGLWQTITQGYGRWYIFPASSGALIAAVDSAENARLIGAAPELYAALRDLLGAHLSLVRSGDCGFWNPEREADEIRAARAALRKVGGQDEPC